MVEIDTLPKPPSRTQGAIVSESSKPGLTIMLVGSCEIDVVVVEGSTLRVVAKVVGMVDESEVTLSVSLTVEDDPLLEVADSLVLLSSERVVEYEIVVDESVSTRGVVEDRVVEDADSVSLGTSVVVDKMEVTDEE